MGKLVVTEFVSVDGVFEDPGGSDAANGTYVQLYSDERGVCRVYEMSIGDGEWKLWREGEPFPQRFTATFGNGGARSPAAARRLRTA